MAVDVLTPVCIPARLQFLTQAMMQCPPQSKECFFGCYSLTVCITCSKQLYHRTLRLNLYELHPPSVFSYIH